MESQAPSADPRRWITLGIVLTAVLITGLDVAVLNVAIPTILRDFHTTLPALQWVMTGYSLTFAACLIIGGRLADIYGARQTFIVGAVLFAVGSLIAALSTGVPMLVAGEAVIEGFGASLMLPASLAILTGTFHGRERAQAFSMWTAVMGTAFVLGPLVGGFLTTNFSWRWAFMINVIVAPFAIVGILVLTRREPAPAVREPLDVQGALLIASGMTLLVFGISEGARYGWWRPVERFVVGGVTIVPAGSPVSPTPIAFLGAVGLLLAFYRVERAKERRHAWPLFEFEQLRHLGFRYGLATLLFLAMGQVTFVLVTSVVLQNARHLSALDTGLWLVPTGIAIVVGSQLGARLTHVIGTMAVVRIGVGSIATALAVASVVLSPTVSFVHMLPIFVLVGIGVGFAVSQLTNVTLRDVPVEKSGAASGANSTVRMVGAALGVATVSALLSVLTVSYAIHNLRHAHDLAAPTRARAVTAVRNGGVTVASSAKAPPRDAAIVQASVGDAISSAAQQAMRFGAGVVTIGFALSFLIPDTVELADELLVEGEIGAEALAQATTSQ